VGLQCAHRQDLDGAAAEQPEEAAEHARRAPGRYTLLTEPLVRRRANGTPGKVTRVMLEELARRSAGAPLPERLRGPLARELGADLGAVRVHRDARAARAAEVMGAEAFAVGRDVYFAAGAYDETSPAGRRLIAHEVAHTVQQSGAAAADTVAVTSPGDRDEQEADRFADRFAARDAAPDADRDVARGEPSRIITPDQGPRLVQPAALRVARVIPQHKRDQLDRCPAPEWEDASMITIYNGAVADSLTFLDKSLHIADVSLVLAGIPLDADLSLQMMAGADYSANAGAYILDHEEQGDDRPEWLCGNEPGPDHRGEFRAVANARGAIDTDFGLNGKFGLFFDTLTAGFEAHFGIHGSAQLTAPLKLKWSGEFDLENGKPRIPTVDELQGSLDLAWQLKATAGVKFWVKLGFPEPIHDLFEEVGSWPVIGWLVPTLPELRLETPRYDWVLFDFDGAHNWALPINFHNLGGGGSPSLDLGRPQDGWFRELFAGGDKRTAEVDDKGLPEDMREGMARDTLASSLDDTRGKLERARRVLKRETSFIKQETSRVGHAHHADTASTTATASAAGGAGGGGKDGYRGRLAGHADTLRDAAVGLDNLETRVNQEVGQKTRTSTEPAMRGAARFAYADLGKKADDFTHALEDGKLKRPIADEPDAGDKTAKHQPKGSPQEAERERARVAAELDTLLEPVAEERKWADQEIAALKNAGSELRNYRKQVLEYRDTVKGVDNAWTRLEKKLAGIAENHPDDFAEQARRYRGLADDLAALGKRLKKLPRERPRRGWDHEYVIIEDGKLMLDIPYRVYKTLRSTFYGSKYRKPTRTWFMENARVMQYTRDEIFDEWRRLGSQGKQPQVKQLDLYWPYERELSPSTGTYFWKFNDPDGEEPTLDHSRHTVAEHWNRYGRLSTQDERLDYYNGEQPGGRSKNVRLLPAMVNSSRGATPGQDKVDEVRHDVGMKFRGPIKRGG